MTLSHCWNSIFIVAPLILGHSITLADSSFHCDESFKRPYIKMGIDQNVPVYRFTNLRDDFLSELNSGTQPDRLECLSSFYEKAMTDVGAYWSRRISTKSCSNACKKEFQRSSAFLTSLDKEFKRKIKNKLAKQVILTKNPDEGCVSEQMAAVTLHPIHEMHDELCCGKTDQPTTGVVYGIYPHLSRSNCLEKVRSSADDTSPISSALKCTEDLTQTALNRLFENIQGLATLPFELWAARDQIWEVMTHPDLRTAFVQNLSKKIQTFVTDRVESMTSCLNPTEKTKYLCSLSGDLIANLATPAGISKLFQVAKGSVHASAGILEKALPKLDVRKAGEQLSASITQKLVAFTQKKNAFLEALDKNSKEILNQFSNKTQVIESEVKPLVAKVPESPARELLTSKNLLPQYEYSISNGKIAVSRPFMDIGNRKFFVVQVESGGKTETMTFYRSNSSAVFRKLPSYHRRIGWYDKSFSEDALTATPELQEILNSAALNELEAPVVSDMSQLEGVIHVFDSPSDAKYAQFKSQMAKSYESHEILSPNQKTLSDGVGRSFPEPKEIQIADPAHAPNYSHPIRSYTLENPTYGKVTAEVYPSENGQVEYTLMRDSTGKVWFGDIGMTQTSLNSGLRSDFIRGEELTAPLWEYPKQIATPYKSGVYHGSYESNWNYIREIPEIQRYYREKGFNIPQQ